MNTAHSVPDATARPFFFISDLHLSPALPLTVAAFEHFIGVTAAPAQAVYILGDLFEYWVGDDELSTAFAARMCALLRSLGERGIALHIMRGNRDFLLGTGFAHAAGATLLDDSCLVQAFGQRIVLAHGDSLCTLDHAYQNFRRLTRNRAVQAVFLAAPLPWRLALARHLRRRSAMRPAYAPQAPNPRWDVTTAAVDSLLQQWHADTLIHGHTHRPAHHRAPERWVLPDWELDHGAPRGGYLRLDAQGLRMCALDRA
jgi:UDP-2,3-diacylglucosamine hydrolase